MNGSVGGLDRHPMGGRKADYAESFPYNHEVGATNDSY